MSDQPAMTMTNQATYDAMKRLLDALPDEDDRKVVLAALLTNRCKQCLDYDPRGGFWCCYDSRG